MEIKNTYRYVVSDYYVTIEVRADEKGVFFKEFASICDAHGNDVPHTDELEARLSAEINETLLIESGDGEWDAILADSHDDLRFDNEQPSRPVDPSWAPRLNSMPAGYQVH